MKEEVNDLPVISLGLIEQQEYQVKTDENEVRSKRCISNKALQLNKDKIGK